ncbi:MAG: CDP-alcohol phosphatidyltransferase family protein [Desulfohalobiaceae bacterium]
MELRDTALARAYFALQEKTSLAWLGSTRITANQLTILGLLLALLVPGAFFLHPWLGLVFMGLSAAADSLDGPLARKRGEQSSLGAFVDSTSDRVADFFYLCGFWVLFWQQTQQRFLATFLVFSAFLLTVLISYIKARIEGLGGTCQVGLLGRAPRTIYLLCWALLLALWPAGQGLLLWGGLALFWLLSLFTVIQRLQQAHRIWSFPDAESVTYIDSHHDPDSDSKI